MCWVRLTPRIARFFSVKVAMTSCMAARVTITSLAVTETDILVGGGGNDILVGGSGSEYVQMAYQ